MGFAGQVFAARVAVGLAMPSPKAFSQAGATIMPANPGFYNKPTKIEDIIDFMVARILDHLKVSHNLQPRWGE